MKKFLTVLLALSVVFTYSFASVGTAFAASPADFNANVNAAEAQVMAQLNTTYDNVVKGLTAENTDAGIAAGVDAWKAAAKVVYDEKVAEIKEKSNTIKADESTYGEMSVYELVGEYNEISYSDLRTAVYEKDDAAARAQFPISKEETIAKFNAVDLSVYSTTSKSTKEGYTDKTYYELAKGQIDSVIETINGYTIAADANDAAVKTQIDQLNARVSGNLEEIKDTEGKVTGYKLNAAVVEKYGLMTISEENAAALTLEAKKKTFISQMNANIAKYMESTVTGTAEAVAAAKEYITAYETAVTFQIESLTTMAQANSYKVPTINDKTDKYVENLKDFDELVAYAEKYKLEKDQDGNLVRDAAKVDKVVADAKTAAYKAAKWNGLESAKNDIKNNCGVDAAKTTKVVETKKAAIEKARTAALANYYDAEKDAVNKVFDDLLAKVEAAKTDAEVNAITANPTAELAKIKNKTAVDNATNASAAFGTLVEKIKAYQDLVNAGTTDKKDFSSMDAKEEWVTFVGESGARTEAEIAALYDQAVAKVDAVMTASQVAAAKAAVEAQIAALPANITLADKATVEAAWTAANEYKAATGKNDIANEATLNLAVRAVAAAEKASVEAMIKALPAVVTVADKDAVKAAKEAMDAYNALTETGKLYAGESKIYDSLSAKLTTIRNLEKAAVISAINALPLNVTLDNKDAVESARALYDAYAAEYTDYSKPDYAFEDITNREELFKAEAAIAAAEKKENEEKIAAVESLKITASSTAAKGSITVKWKVVGDYDAADGMRVYKSTKKNSGYGANPYFITKKGAMQYKNTKELKKGTRYYYKVRAYVEIDGVKYYSDWSNKAYRIAK